jgi:hypothetical protein
MQMLTSVLISFILASAAQLAFIFPIEAKKAIDLARAFSSWSVRRDPHQQRR